MGQTENITEDLEILRYLNTWLNEREMLWLWQVMEDNNNQRLIHYAMISKVDMLKKEVWIKPAKTDVFRFDRMADLFIYIPKECMAIKVSIRKFEQNYLTFSFPDKMTNVPGDFFENIHLIEQEDEEKFVHMRTCPRRKSGGMQLIGVQITAHNNQARLKDFTLYDLSQGGMAFLASDPGECVVGEKVLLRSIDGKELGKRPKGTVVAIRILEDEDGEKMIKVSVKFD